MPPTDTNIYPGQHNKSIAVVSWICGLPLGEVGAVVPKEEHAAEAGNKGLAREECRVAFAECRRRGRGVLAALRLHAERRAENVVEVGLAIRGCDGVAAADVRFVHELFVAAANQRESVPEEVLRTAVSVVRAGELTVRMVGVGVLPFALGDGEHLVEVAAAVGLVSFLHKSPCRIVGVAGCLAIGRRRDELVRAVEGKGRRFAAHGLPEHIARLVVDVALDVRAILLHRKELSTSVVRIGLADAVRRAGDDLPGLRIFVRDRGVGILLSAEVLARELPALRVDEVDGRAIYRLPREPPRRVVSELHRVFRVVETKRESISHYFVFS